MKKFIPYEKLSKKAKRELDQKKRKSWNGINPVTRKPQNPKAYNRRKAQKYDDSYSVPYFYAVILLANGLGLNGWLAAVLRNSSR